MKPKSNPYILSISSMLAAPIALVSFCFLSPFAFAQTRTWNGGGADNSTLTPANWGGTAPSSGNILNFAGSTRTTPNWDGVTEPAPVNINGITFAAGASAFTLNSGTQNNIQFVAAGNSILNSSSNLQTIKPSASVFFNNVKTFDAGSAGLALDGGIVFRGDGLGGGNNQLILTGSGNSTTTNISELVYTTGTNALTKTGSGRWTITGNATNAGPVTISQGTLEYQGSVASSGITNNSALIFNNAGNQDYNNTIGGSGTLTKQGAGTLTLNGANTYTGATTISSGTLKMGYAGSVVSGAVTNGSFESDAGIANNFQYTTITGWTNGTGIEQGSSATFAPVAGTTGLPNYNASTNSKWAFVQGAQTMSQTVTVSTAGTYTVGFSAAGRAGSNGPLNIQVLVNGTNLTGGSGTITPSQSRWVTYTSNQVNLTAGTHTLAFDFINALGGG